MAHSLQSTRHHLTQVAADDLAQPMRLRFCCEIARLSLPAISPGMVERRSAQCMRCDLTRHTIFNAIPMPLSGGAPA
ncbi:hypothetical protein [Ralstonia solanacearum]|uniref:hypothetical protein n=1 Tax=Ralstonia solanacearum TaxID=305 RepID=UPI0012D35CA5|nr:hypothetical protein [Ralstonia solanacearum]